MLLIVPYGIETRLAFFGKSFYYLLIVPYGIETKYSDRTYKQKRTFNCTLWN